MARMRTGRLTKMTTPPQKPIVSSKPGVSNVSNQAEWDKYDQDYKAYKNYDNELKSYQSQKKKYDEEMKGASGGYNYRMFEGGKSGTRRLNPAELAEFNTLRKSDNPDALDLEWADIPKSSKSLKDVKAYQGKSKAPVAPTKRPEPIVPEILDKMPILKPGPIKIAKRTIKTREEAPAPEKFVNPPKPIGGKTAKSNLKNDHRLLGVDYTATVRKNIKTGRNKLTVENVHLARKFAPKGYKREEKQFKAYAGQTATGDSFLDMTPKDIKAYRKEAKSIRAEYRKQPDSDTRSMGKAAMTSEIRQSRKAEKFAKKVYDFKGKGGVKFFNDKNYKGNIIKDYRESEDNANNRNNMKNKLQAIGEKTSKRRAELEKSKTGGFQYNQVNQ